MIFFLIQFFVFIFLSILIILFYRKYFLTPLNSTLVVGITAWVFLASLGTWERFKSKNFDEYIQFLSNSKASPLVGQVLGNLPEFQISLIILFALYLILTMIWLNSIKTNIIRLLGLLNFFILFVMLILNVQKMIIFREWDYTTSFSSTLFFLVISTTLMLTWGHKLFRKIC